MERFTFVERERERAKRQTKEEKGSEKERERTKRQKEEEKGSEKEIERKKTEKENDLEGKEKETLK